MRSFVPLFMLAALACWTIGVGLGQQPTGPATLESLLKSGEPQKPAAAVTDASPKGPAGTVKRPKDGVTAPDLDKAWAEYDAAVAKATESIKTAISKQFDAATAKGDLDAAEKWQLIGKKFEKAGELPAEPEMKPAVNAAIAEYKKAIDELAKAYEAVVKALTMEKKILEAKAARDELQVISTVATPVKPAQKGGERNLFEQMSGEWVIRYTNGAKRRYVIKEDGQVDFAGSRARLVAKSGFFVLDFHDGKIERIKLDGRRLIVEHYNPANTLGRSQPNCTGAGERE